MNEWIPFTGEYEKQFYDIRLKDGRELVHCWPNAGDFHAFNGVYVKGGYVTHFKVCDQQMPPRSDR